MYECGKVVSFLLENSGRTRGKGGGGGEGGEDEAASTQLGVPAVSQ
jgi:hypothetical protein